MKKLAYIFGLIVAFSSSSCEDAMEETLNEINETQEIDAQEYEYTISSDDYADIVPSNNEDYYEVNERFDSEDDAIDRIPAIIKEYFSGAEGDKVTAFFNMESDDFNTKNSNLESITTLTDSFINEENQYTLVDEDYPVGGSEAFFPNTEVSSDVLATLNAQFPNPNVEEVYTISYNQYTEEPTLVDGKVDIEAYTFDDGNFSGWEAFDLLGSQSWNPSSRDSNIEISGYSGGDNANTDWLVSPSIDLTGIENPQVQINQLINYLDTGSAAELKVMISSDYVGDVEADIWELIDFDDTPEGNAWDYVTSENYDLPEYSGETVNIAFKYNVTDADSPTWRIEELNIFQAGGDAYEGEFETNTEYYTYDNGVWSVFEDMYILTTEDYDAMGTADDQPGQYDSFSNSVEPQNYIPQFLVSKYYYAQEGEIVYIGYDFFTGSTDTVFSPFVIQEGEWIIYDEDNLPLGDSVIESSLRFKYDTDLAVFVEDGATPYTLTEDDYDTIVTKLNGDEELESQLSNLDQYGNFNTSGGSTNWTEDQIEIALAVVLEAIFPDAEEEALYEVTYSYYDGSSGSESKTLQYLDGEFSYYVEATE